MRKKIVLIKEFVVEEVEKGYKSNIRNKKNKFSGSFIDDGGNFPDPSNKRLVVKKIKPREVGRKKSFIEKLLCRKTGSGRVI